MRETSTGNHRKHQLRRSLFESVSTRSAVFKLFPHLNHPERIPSGDASRCHAGYTHRRAPILLMTIIVKCICWVLSRSIYTAPTIYSWFRTRREADTGAPARYKRRKTLEKSTELH